MIVDKTIHVAHVGTFGNKGPWLHFNLGDVCPPGHDLREVLREPKGRSKRLAAWADAMRAWDKGLLWQLADRRAALGDKPIVGASMEAEEIVPVPHRFNMVADGDSIAAYGFSLKRALWHISEVVGMPVVPYGVSQVLKAHTTSELWEHRQQAEQWYAWHRPGGPLRGVTPCQSFYANWQDAMVQLVAWAYAALDRHAAVGNGTGTKPLTVFVSPELQGSAGAGESDGFAEMDPLHMTKLLKAIDLHPLECRVVSWFKASTAARAQRAMQIVDETAAGAGLSVSV